jgi:2-(1,2-epoxy-1,2-dihydrophenyl)acetyl-CoA isomerase
MADYETLIFEQTGGVAKITLNRPDAANGINLSLGEDLLAVSIRCGGDPSVRAVLLTANGKMFSAGGDLKAFAAFGDEIGIKLKELTTNMHAAIANFARMDAPLVVAVNGMAAGAGFSLAITGDIVLAAESAKFTMAYTAAGLSPDGASSYYLPRLIGVRKTQELMITNRRLKATEALDWGLINQVIADDELMTEAEELAAKLADGPTRAFGVVKKLVMQTFDNGLETQMELESRYIAAMTTLEDGKEGIAAFMEKRPPQFKGR